MEVDSFAPDRTAGGPAGICAWAPSLSQPLPFAAELAQDWMDEMFGDLEPPPAWPLPGRC